MSYDFRHSLRAIEGSRRSPITIVAALVLLVAWGLWFAFGKVSVYVTTPSSKIEVEGAALPIETSVEGRIVSTALKLGAHVKAGDVLVVQDAREDALRLEEQTARRESARAEIEALRGQIAAEERALDQYKHLAVASHGEAIARSREARVAAELAQKEAARGEKLRRTESIAEVEYERLSSAATRQRMTSEAMAYGRSRTALESKVGESERLATLGSLHTEEHRMEGEQAAREASIHLLEIAIDKRTLRAPVDGTIGSVAPLQPGARLKAGEVVGTLVPERELQLVASLPAAEALGRVHAGQRARLRLDGFPWTQFGAVEATVARVAEEESDGMIRAELTADRESARRVSLQHGLSGSMEVEVDRVTPAALILRRIAGPLGVAR